MISHFKKNIPGYGFDAFGHPLKYRSALEAGCAATRIPTAGLIFYAPLNAYSDNAVTGHELNYDGDVTFGTQRGIPCAFFDGYGQIYTSETIGISGNHPATVSALFESFDDYREWSHIAMFGNINRSGGILSVTTNYNKIVASSNSTEVSSEVEASGKMFHAASVSDGEKMTLYIDGNLIGSVPVTFDLGDTPLLISGEEIGNDALRFNGAISSVRVYDRALSAAEIKSLSGEFNV